MQALNFLYEKPLVNWLDFFVKTENLSNYFQKPTHNDPPLEHLVTQFCEQARSEEKEAESQDYNEADRKYHKIKASKLWLLAMSCCSKMNWNLNKICREVPLNIQRDLIDHLLYVTTVEGGSETRSIELILSQFDIVTDWNTLNEQNRFGLWIYIRWCFTVDFIRRTPQPPAKISVSNPYSMPDPNQTFVETENAALTGIRQFIPFCLKLLERWVVQNKKEVKIANYQCFLPNEQESMIWAEEHKPNFNLEWSTISFDQVIIQSNYDLAQYYFSEKIYGKSRERLQAILSIIQHCSSFSDHLTVDVNAINGYSIALGLSKPEKVTKSIVNENLDEKTIQTLVDDKEKELSLVSRFSLEEKTKNIPNQSIGRRIVAENCFRTQQEFLALIGRCLCFFNDKNNCLAFLQVINRRLASMSENERTAMEVYFKFLSFKSNVFSEIVKEIKWNEFNMGKFAVYKPNSVQPLPMPTAAMINDYKEMKDDYWQLLTSFDPAELKVVLPTLAAQGALPFRERLPARYIVPPLFEVILGRIPVGPLQELMTLFAAKMEQLGTIGKIDDWQRLANACMVELNVLNLANDTQIQTSMTQEALRVELEEWHIQLCHPDDVGQFGQFTSQLAEKVKSFISATGNTFQPSVDLSALVSAFLINTSDREYIIGKCEQFQSRYMDVSKMLAAFCHALEKDQGQLRHVAQTFYQVMLPTMEDIVQHKRTVGGVNQSVHRENPRQFLTRSQLVTFVRYIREQTAISILLSFFGKLFNSVHNDMVKMFTEHGQLWPAGNEANNINEAFLNEIISITLDNGLIINPNNAFCLRSKAEFLLANEEYGSAMEYYLQCLVACSDCFVKHLPENVVDDTMIENMMKCSSKLNCHTQEALLCQFMNEPNESYQIAIKALQQSHTIDAQASYFTFIWDTNLFEYLVDILNRTGQKEKLNQVLNIMSTQDLNCHNVTEVNERSAAVRKKDFLMALCSHHF